MVREPRAEAVAVATRGIDKHGALIARAVQDRKISQTVGDGGHQTVDARGLLTANGIGRLELSHQLGVFLPFLA